MDTPEPPEQPEGSLPDQVKSLLASPEVAEAIESDQFKRFLDHIPIAIAISKPIDGEQRIQYANAAFETFTGQRPSAIEGKSWSFLDAFVGEDDPQRRLDQEVLSGGDFLGVFKSIRSGAPSGVVQAYSSIIESDDGSEDYRLVALVDVSERERAQRELFEREIRDKDLLLQEVQHRVKNNLQLIVGLIRLEARGARRGEAVDLDRLAGRIDCLKSLYLTISEPSNDLDLGQYLSQVASAVVRAHGDDDIRLVLKADVCQVSVNVAMPMGLAVNELLTNALKYAFDGRMAGTITVECLRHEDRYRVLVADDGVGFAAGASWPTPGTLGALIVQSLRENTELDLKVETAPGRGTRTVFIFLPRTKGRQVH